MPCIHDEKDCDITSICNELHKLGYTNTQRWLAIILFIRNIISEISIVDNNQKIDLQGKVIRCISAKDSSDKNYKLILDSLENAFINNVHAVKLNSELAVHRSHTENLIETISNFLAESIDTVKDRAIENFGEEVLDILNRKDDKDVMVPKLRVMVTNMLKHYRDEAKKWETKAIQLEQMVNTDPLLNTIHNRRAFERHLSDAASVHDKGHPLSLILIDIDDFKIKINDQHGHQVGDDVLRVLGKILSSHALNTNSFAARYGGDELAMICNVKGEEARSIAKAIRDDVFNYEFRPRVNDKLSNEIIKFTVSIGVAECQDGWTPEKLIDSADNAMYFAKESGKNDVALFYSDI